MLHWTWLSVTAGETDSERRGLYFRPALVQWHRLVYIIKALMNVKMHQRDLETLSSESTCHTSPWPQLGSKGAMFSRLDVALCICNPSDPAATWGREGGPVQKLRGQLTWAVWWSGRNQRNPATKQEATPKVCPLASTHMSWNAHVLDGTCTHTHVFICIIYACHIHKCTHTVHTYAYKYHIHIHLIYICHMHTHHIYTLHIYANSLIYKITYTYRYHIHMSIHTYTYLIHMSHKHTYTYRYKMHTSHAYTYHKCIPQTHHRHTSQTHAYLRVNIHIPSHASSTHHTHTHIHNTYTHHIHTMVTHTFIIYTYIIYTYYVRTHTHTQCMCTQIYQRKQISK